MSLYVKSCNRRLGSLLKASSKTSRGRLERQTLTYGNMETSLKRSTIDSTSPSYSSSPSMKRYNLNCSAAKLARRLRQAKAVCSRLKEKSTSAVGCFFSSPSFPSNSSDNDRQRVCQMGVKFGGKSSMYDRQSDI